MKSGIYLDTEVLASLEPEVLRAVLAAVLPRQVDAEALAEGLEGDEYPADLTPSLAQKFIAGCSEKTRKVLKIIAEQPRKFRWSAVIDLYGGEASDISGVWGAITKRTRTVLGDPEALLIWWTPINDGADHDGEISPLTHAALRKVFKIG